MHQLLGEHHNPNWPEGHPALIDICGRRAYGSVRNLPRNKNQHRAGVPPQAVTR